MVTTADVQQPGCGDRLGAHGPEPRRVGVVIVCGVERDRLLIACVAAGDDDALAELFDRYGALVLGVARRVLGNVAAAEDVVQDVFTALWCHPERFDPERGSLRAYLGVHAHRRAVDVVRHETRRQRREQGQAAGHTCDGQDQVVVTEVVREAIGRLPDDQRRAVELAFWEGRTHREVAEVLGIPFGTAKSRLRLAQAKLSEWLAPLALELT
jgi:RNA polymerase sigma-70 factor (ECF subfamily)